KMIKAGFMPIVINANMVDQAHEPNRNISDNVQMGITMILISPKQLCSRRFEGLINESNSKFCNCDAFVAADEGHCILNSWGR
ncbi:hypothetical protein EDB19DRAFT_1601686, partial [Suillus lakei]